MEKYQSISSKFIMIAAVIWAFLAFSGTLTIGQSYMGIGALAFYISIQNIILLNWGKKIGRMPKKIAYQIERSGHNKGIINFVVINILIYMFVGLAALYGGYTML